MEFIWLMNSALVNLFHCVKQHVCKCYKDGMPECVCVCISVNL